MALESNTSTSVFTVTDEAMLNKLLSELQWTCEEEPIVIHQGDTWRFANPYGSIVGIFHNDRYYDEGRFYAGLQKIIPKDNCVAIYENYQDDTDPFDTGSYCVLITHDNIDYISIRSEAERHARRLTGNYNIEIM